MMLRKSAAIGAVSVFLSCQLALAEQMPAGFTIAVIQGNEAVNYTNQEPAQVPMVRVMDSSGRPLAGARVSFQVPDSGPSATFKGARTYTAVTRRGGIAKAEGFTANDDPGPFTMTVVAEYDGQTAQQQVAQNNVASPAKSHHRALALKIAIGCAAAAGFGVILYEQFIAKNKPYGQR